MTEIRCVKCHRLLFKMKVTLTGYGMIVEIKCGKCHFINTIKIDD